LSEQEYQFERLPYPWKLKQYVVPHRLTFQDAFNFAERYYPGRLIVIANADIYFDNSLYRVCKDTSTSALPLNMSSKAFALGTWSEVENNDGTSSLSISFRTDSQDAWMFRSPMDRRVVERSSFYLGAVRADNVIAQILLESGYEVTNPMFGLHAIESDSRTRIGNLYDLGGAAYGEMANVYLSDKMEFN
jgi:hypothetical protein